MNLKKSLYILIILTMLFTGCSNYQAQNKGISLPDEATKQKTMTKIQNNLNEIVDKDYNYVLNNLGEPYATTYWIDKSDLEKLEELDSLEEIENLTDINLVYLKNVSNEDTNSSALYLQLKDKLVKKAQIVDYSSPNIVKKKSKILIDCYSDADVISESELDIKKLDDFIGVDSNEISKIVGNKQPSYDAYLYDKSQKYINIYNLDDGDKLLAIFIKDNKIFEIKILDNEKEAIGEIKNIILYN